MTTRLEANEAEVPFVRVCGDCAHAISVVASQLVEGPADIANIDVERPVPEAS
jgi:hypothetical protein